MCEEFDSLTLHQKMKLLIKEMVEIELPIKEALKEFEKIYIDIATQKYNGKKSKMARALGIHRNTLCNIIKRLKSD
ncbi:MAG: hypothetical protein IBX60_08270 [Candidatus Aminicenantes bacterium]|nr:hypothetical protein [Candidatus Aminicenantes bacterium]